MEDKISLYSLFGSLYSSYLPFKAIDAVVFKY